MENKKIAATALIIAIALSIAGIVYAHWSDTATVSGQIKMGTLTLTYDIYEAPTCEEYYHNPVPGGLPIWLAGEAEGKDVGKPRAWYSDLITDVHTLKQGFKTLNIEINNSYPQYAVHTHFMVHNIGTVPLCVYGISMVGEKQDYTGAHINDTILDWWYNSTSGHIEGNIYEDVDGSGTVTPGDILVMHLVMVDTEFPLQVEPCHSEKMEIDIDFKQEAEMCHTYILNFQLWAVQWNKVSEVTYPIKT
jgi:predicted ribosomally synthesized peptide with SipW-like signal peptide